MKIGVGEWGFREIPIEKHGEIAQRLGFRYLELGIGKGIAGRLRLDMPGEKIAAIKADFTERGITTPFMCLENDFTRGEVEAEVERVCEEIEFSAQFGAKFIRMFVGFADPAEVTGRNWDRLVDAFKKTGGVCEKLGMEISIETHGRIEPGGKGVRHFNTISTDLEALARLMDDLPKNVGFNYDPGNIKALIGRDPFEYTALLNGRINYCHLKDWLLLEDGTWVAAGVGDGDMNWEKLLSEIEFDGVFLIEYEPTHDVEEGILRSLKYLRDHT